MKKLVCLLLLVAAVGAAVNAAEFHVATSGNDAANGMPTTPFRTIQHAAEIAQPGDVVTVHAGTYRERIHPVRGGTAENRRIVFQAAAGEQVEVKGSEVITNWVNVQGDVWQVILPNSYFGDFNPYRDLIRGDWFDRRGRDHHTGAVYLNGNWLVEAAKLDELKDAAGTNALWFGQVSSNSTTIWAEFTGVNPQSSTCRN